MSLEVSRSVSFSRKFVCVAALALMLLGGGEARAADGDLAWASADSATGLQINFGTTFDDNGNIITVGHYVGTVDLDPGAGTDSFTAAGAADVYVYKMDSSGNYIWGRSFGGSSGDQPYAVATDPAGNIYVTGYFGGTADFNPGAGTFSLSSNGSNDIFVSKLDSSGNFEWAVSAGASGLDQGKSIAVDDDGIVYVTGYFTNTVDFDPGAGTYNLTMNGSREGYVLKLDTDGNFVWAATVGTASGDSMHSIAIDGAGNSVVGGLFGGSGGIATLNASGTVLSTYTGLGTEVKGINVDSAGSVYASGYFSGTVDFDPGAGTANQTASGSSSAFVLKLDSAGAYVWSFSVPATSNSAAQTVDVDGADNIFIAGYVNGTSDFDPGAGTASPTVYGGNDCFVAKYTSAGAYVWAQTVGGTSSDIPYACAVDSYGNTATVGTYQGTGDFDPGTGTLTFTNSGSDDGFLMKLQAPADTTGPLAASIVPATGGPTNATSVDFKVKFNESVQNLDSAADFIVSHSGTASSGVTLSGGPRVYTATVTGVSGDGSFTLAINPASDVRDFSSNPLTSSVTSSAVSIDNTGPSVNIGAPSATLVNPTATVSFPITITGASTVNLSSGNVSIAYAGSTSGGTVNVLNGTTANPTVEVSGVGAAGAGHYTISIAAGVATDSLSNASLAAGPSAQVFVDAIAPTLSIGAPTGAPISNSYGEILFPVTVSGADSVNLIPANVSISYGGTTSGGTVSVLNGTTAAPSVRVSQVSGNGDISITVAAGVGSDTAGNQTASAGSVTARVDNTAPVYSSVSVNPSTAYEGQDVEISFLASEFAAVDPDVTVNGNPATRSAKGSPAYVYTYAVLPTDPAGPATIAISGIDDAGNVAALTDSTSFTIANVPQNVPVMAWPAALVLAAAGAAALRRARK